MADFKHVALILRSDRSLDRGVAYGVGDFVEADGSWSLYVDPGDIRSISDLRRWQIDGVIGEYGTSWALRVAQAMGLPYVGFGGYSMDQSMPYPVVMSDHEAIGRIAAEHLVEQGLRHFAFCGSDLRRDYGWSKRRFVGFNHRLRESGYSASSYSPPPGATKSWDKRLSSLCAWLADLPKPVGILAFFDQRARELLEACRLEGIHVPEQAAIIGVDDDRWICNLARPKLTSVAAGSRLLGYKAARLLDGLMRGESIGNESVLIQPQGVVVRGSTDVLGFQDHDVAVAVRFIRSRACDPITVDDVLDHAGMSASTAHRKFTQHLRRSVHQEIQRVQMDRAKSLLTMGNKSVKQIAYEVGFENTNYMSKLFLKLVGRTPTDYRREFSHPVYEEALSRPQVSPV